MKSRHVCCRGWGGRGDGENIPGRGTRECDAEITTAETAYGLQSIITPGRHGGHNNKCTNSSLLVEQTLH